MEMNKECMYLYLRPIAGIHSKSAEQHLCLHLHVLVNFIDPEAN